MQASANLQGASFGCSCQLAQLAIDFSMISTSAGVRELGVLLNWRRMKKQKVLNLRWMELKSCLIVLHSILASIYSSGQQFNTRFDTSQLNTTEIGFDIEFVNGKPVAIISALFPTQNKTAFVFLDNDGQPTDYKYLDDPVLSVYPGWCNAVGTTPEGGYIHGGAIAGLDQGVYAALLDNNADTIWTKTITWEGDSTTDAGFKAKMFDDEIMIVGRQGSGIQLDGIALKLDLNGSLIWKKVYGGAGNEDILYFDKSHIEGYFLTGTSRSMGGPDTDAWILKIDDEGEEEWSFIIDSPGDSPAPQIIATQDGNYVLIITSDDGLNEQISLMKIDEDGDEIWTQEYGVPHPQWTIFSAKELEDGPIVMCGRRSEAAQLKGFVMKCSSEGDSLWSRTYTSIPGNYCELRDIVPNDFGGFTAIGYNYLDPNEDIEQDTWVIQTDSLGCIVPGCHVGLEEQELQPTFTVYPNPSTGMFTINTSSDQLLDMRVFDSTGRQIFDVQKGKAPYDFELKVESGIYVVRIDLGNTEITKRIVVLR